MTLISTIATTTATLKDFQRLSYLRYCYYCNTDRFSTTLLFALLLLLQHWKIFNDSLICTITTATLTDFQRLLFALLLLLQHWQIFNDSYLHYYYYNTDRFSTTLICTIATTTTLTDFQRLSYLHYCYYYFTDRFWTTLICPTTTTALWQIFNDSYLHYCYYCNTDRFSTSLLFTLPHSKWFLFYLYFHYYYTLSDFERVFHLHDNSQIVQHLLGLSKILERDITCTTTAEFWKTFSTLFY